MDIENQSVINTDALKNFFRDQGLTQKHIADMLQVSQPLVSDLLNGRKAFGKKQADTWGRLFGLSPSWLLTGKGEMITANGSDNIIQSGIVQGNNNQSTYNKESMERLLAIIESKDRQIEKLLNIIENQSKIDR